MINDTRLTILLEWNKKKKGKIRFTEKNIIDIFPREFFRFLHLFMLRVEYQWDGESEISFPLEIK